MSSLQCLLCLYAQCNTDFLLMWSSCMDDSFSCLLCTSHKLHFFYLPYDRLSLQHYKVSFGECRVCCVVPRVDLEDLFSPSAKRSEWSVLWSGRSIAKSVVSFLLLCCKLSPQWVIHHLELALLHLLALLYFLGRVSGMGPWSLTLHQKNREEPAEAISKLISGGSSARPICGWFNMACDMG